MVIEYVREKYRDELEFLWEKSPDNAVWHRLVQMPLNDI